MYDEDDTPYFPNKLDDYLENQDDPVAVQGANEYYYLISGSDALDSNLPENVFLKKFKFTDGQNRLIDEEGRLIDQDGKHIDENGLYIKWNKNGTTTSVDANGRKVNDEGRFDVKSSPFLDDEGSPIDESKYEDEPKPKKKRKTRAKKKVEVVAEEETEAEEVEAEAEEVDAEATEAEVS